QVLSSGTPVDHKLSLLDTIAYPVESHVHCTGVALFQGVVGVVACPGARNYHHWLFDTIPRFHLLRRSGWLEQLDAIIVDHETLPFQAEALTALGIETDKLIVPAEQWRSHLEADTLIVPSLPSDLCTVSDWVVDFLRKTFLVDPVPPRADRHRRLFISRRRAPTRCERNLEEILSFLSKLGFEEYFAEDHSIAQSARDFAEAEWIIGMHGSGLSNLVFCTSGSRVIEFLPPRHLDPYYWILSNHTGCKHGYLFAEGERSAEGVDLVSHKVDADVVVSVDKLERLMKRLDAAS
ncbi:MAG: glycosyltransferase family 61 protein, partial [Nitrospirota bacterium]